MLEELEKVPWPSLAQPSWNASDTVAAALRGLGSCASETASREAYDRVLYALGNNHAGTYYPVVLAALPFLAEILEGGGAWARIATLDVLIELSTSFEPEPSFEMVVTPAGERMDLRVLVRQGVARFSPLIRSVAAADTAGERERQLAARVAKAADEAVARNPPENHD
jgi:hypothetical protein